jgi:hypothetical protein
MSRRSQRVPMVVGETLAERSSVPPTPEQQGTTEGASLDSQSLDLLRSLFLLLDEWDRNLQDSSKDSPEGNEFSVDLKST